jgi:hypothetical protein
LIHETDCQLEFNILSAASLTMHILER